MTKEEHRKHHIKLHASLDILVADFIMNIGNLPSKTNIFKLIK